MGAGEGGHLSVRTNILFMKPGHSQLNYDIPNRIAVVDRLSLLAAVATEILFGKWNSGWGSRFRFIDAGTCPFESAPNFKEMNGRKCPGFFKTPAQYLLLLEAVPTLADLHCWKLQELVQILFFAWKIETSPPCKFPSPTLRCNSEVASTSSLHIH